MVKSRTIILLNDFIDTYDMESEDEDGGDKAKTKRKIKARIAYPESQETKDLYKNTNNWLKSKFGEESRAYQKIISKININEARGSNFAFNNAVQNYLQETNAKERVATLDDLEYLYNKGEYILEGIHTHPPEIILRSFDSEFNGNNPIISNLEKQLANSYDFSRKNPLRIINPEIIKDNNSQNMYGFLLEIGKETQIKNDSRFSYKNFLENFPLNGQNLYNYPKQDGLSSIQAGDNSYIDTKHGNLTYSTNNSRMILIE